MFVCHSISLLFRTVDYRVCDNCDMYDNSQTGLLHLTTCAKYNLHFASGTSDSAWNSVFGALSPGSCTHIDSGTPRSVGPKLCHSGKYAVWYTVIKVQCIAHLMIHIMLASRASHFASHSEFGALYPSQGGCTHIDKKVANNTPPLKSLSCPHLEAQRIQFLF